MQTASTKRDQAVSVQSNEIVRISELMEQSGVKFGTSGARGLAVDMTDRVCYAYTLAFLQYLMEKGDISRGDRVAIAADYRPSSPRIMAAVALAVHDAGCEVFNGGFVPSPAIALYGIEHGIASIMVTGSHIPDDRNGIKFNKPAGEILKQDEQDISAASVAIPAGLFDTQGKASKSGALPEVDDAASRAYVQRYLDYFPPACLAGLRVGIYQHSSVARDLFVDIFAGLGAEVVALARSDKFIPVDTEAVRPEDVRLAREWSHEQHFDCIVSADGDGDRPLVSDEQGNWLRGDVAGILCARYLGATSVATPVSSNSALEKSGWFKRVERTRIGSPFVIEAMQWALAQGEERVVGYEANGGFLIASDVQLDGRILRALPTRDAAIVPLAILMLARQSGVSISALLQQLPQRYTSSDRLKAFPTELSQARIAAFNTGNPASDKAAIEAVFGCFGRVKALDRTDGLRITFDNEEIVHLRPSGNAPELRCYNEAATQARAAEMNVICLEIMNGWRE
jgi:phosphomannomutase